MCELPIKIEFGGGAEMLFGGQKKHEVVLPAKEENWSMKDLLTWIQGNMLKERPDLFIQDDSVRPGILVLVNDTDWELMDTLKYEIQPKDTIVFLSTLHGG